MRASRWEPIEVVCFDIGGVLVRIWRSWVEACEASGLPVHSLPPEFSERRQHAAEAHQVGAIDDAAYYTEVAAASGDRYSPREVESIHDAWIRSEYEGAAALVQELHQAARVRLACLSNTNAAHWRRLAPDPTSAGDEYPSLARLETRLASHLLGLAKPDPAIFDSARERLAASADRILLFDDLPANVAAARAAGWRAERIDPFGDPVQQMRAYLASLDLLS